MDVTASVPPQAPSPSPGQVTPAAAETGGHRRCPSAHGHESQGRTPVF